MTAPSATSKHKTMELYNPTKVVELKFTGTLSFKWAFKWEEYACLREVHCLALLTSHSYSNGRYGSTDTNSSGDAKNAS